MVVEHSKNGFFLTLWVHLETMNPQKLSKTFKALSNPNRLEIFLEIMRTTEASYETDSDCFIYELMNSLKIGAPTISHHLKELTNAGLIETERKGKYLVARLNRETIREASEVLSLMKKK